MDRLELPNLGTALLCKAGRQSIAIPIELAGQVVEYEVTPLPLARSGVRGLARHEDRVLISLGLGAGQQNRPARLCKGILLSLPQVEGLYALEVDLLGSLSKMRRAAGHPNPGGVLWIHAIDEQSRPHLWFDAASFVRALLSAPPAERRAAP